MAFNAVRDDIFSILQAYASPRQGPKDNVTVIGQEALAKQQPPPPPQEPALPFTKPQPVTSKVVPDERANLPAEGASPAQMAPPPAQPAPPPTSGAPVTVTPPSTASAGEAPGPMPTAGGGMDLFALWQQEQERNRKAQAMQGLVSGAQLALAGATRSPSMRETLAEASKSNNPALHTGNGSGAGGAFPFEQLTKMQAAGQAAAELNHWRTVAAPAIAKRHKIPLEILLNMDEKNRSELLGKVAAGDKLMTFENADGSKVVKSERTGETFATQGPDKFKQQDQAIKVQDADIRKADEDRKVTEQGVLQQRRVALAKIATERPDLGLNPGMLDAMSDSDASSLLGKLQDPNLPIEKGKLAVAEANSATQRDTENRQVRGENRDIAKDATMQSNLKDISALTQVPENVLKGYTPQQLTELIDKQTPEIKNYLFNKMQASKGDTGFKEQQQLDQDRKAELERVKAGLPVAAKVHTDRIEKLGAEVEATLGDARIRNLQLQTLVNSPKGIVAGTAASGLMREVRKFNSAYQNVPDDKVTASEALEILAEERVGKILASGQYGAGTGISNADQEAARKRAGGSSKLNAETLRRSMLIQNLMGRADVARRNDRIDESENILGPTLMGKGTRAKVPEIKADVVGVLDNQQLAQVLSGDAGREAFDGDWGRGSTDEVIKNLDKGIEQKFATWDENKRMKVGATDGLYKDFQTSSVEELERNRTNPKVLAQLEKLQLTPDIFDVVIAAKKLGKMGGDPAQKGP